MSDSGKAASIGTVSLMAFVSNSALEAVRDLRASYPNMHAEAGDVGTATAYLKDHSSPEILLVEVASAEVAPALLDALADVVNSKTKVIVTGTMDSYRFYHWLMDLGIHEYVLQPFTTDQLRAAIVKGGKKLAAAVAEAAVPQQQRLIAVMGARGGVGTTTVAINLAAQIARGHQQSTALLDLDYYFGSVALGMDLDPVKGFRDALEQPDRVDGMFIERVMVRPFQSLAMLAAEEPLHEIINTQGNAGDAILGALKEKFPVVVVDVPRQMNPLTRHVLLHATDVLVVANSQLTDLRDALRIRDYLVEHLKRPAPQFILNRVGLAPREELPPGEFKKHMGSNAAAKLPYVVEAIAASAQGALLLDDPKAKAIAAPLIKLAANLMGEALQDASPSAEAKQSVGALLQKWKQKK